MIVQPNQAEKSQEQGKAELKYASFYPWGGVLVQSTWQDAGPQMGMLDPHAITFSRESSLT